MIELLKICIVIGSGLVIGWKGTSSLIDTAEIMLNRHLGRRDRG